jgi:hypothetical protein
MSYEMPRTDHPGAKLPPVPGEDHAAALVDAEGQMTDADSDFETNELHADGRTCVVCHATITATQEVRRHLDGSYQHEICPK